MQAHLHHRYEHGCAEKTFAGICQLSTKLDSQRLEYLIDQFNTLHFELPVRI